MAVVEGDAAIEGSADLHLGAGDAREPGTFWENPDLLAQQAAKGLAAERKTLAFREFFAEMMVVRTDVGASRKLHYPFMHCFGQSASAKPPAVGVCQSQLPLLASGNQCRSL